MWIGVLGALAACESLLHVCADTRSGCPRLCSRVLLPRSVAGALRAEAPGAPAAQPRPASAHANLLALRGGRGEEEGAAADVTNATAGGGAAGGQGSARSWEDGDRDSVTEEDSENWDYAKFGLTAPVVEEGVNLNAVRLPSEACRGAPGARCAFTHRRTHAHAHAQGMTGAQGEAAYLSNDHHIGKWGWTALHRAACEVVFVRAARPCSGGPPESACTRGCSSHTPAPLLQSTHAHTTVHMCAMHSWAHVHACEHAHGRPQGDATTLGKMLAMGGDANTATLNGWTPLIEAASEGHLECVRLLLRHGALVNQPTKGVSFLPPRHSLHARTRARAHAHTRARTHAPRPGRCTPCAHSTPPRYTNAVQGWSALHFAAGNAHMETIQELLAQGADKYWQDSYGDFPMVSPLTPTASPAWLCARALAPFAGAPVAS